MAALDTHFSFKQLAMFGADANFAIFMQKDGFHYACHFLPTKL